VAQAAMFSLNRTAEWMKGQVSKELSAEKRLNWNLSAQNQEKISGEVCDYSNF
jgi:hypothetical protein